MSIFFKVDVSSTIPLWQIWKTIAFNVTFFLFVSQMVPIGARLAEMARIRLKYDESRRQVQHIQQSLAALEERISPGSLESDKDRLLLIQEKEQLLRELRSITPRSRTDAEMANVRQEIGKLEMDLSNAFEHSNRYSHWPKVSYSQYVKQDFFTGLFNILS